MAKTTVQEHEALGLCSERVYPRGSWSSHLCTRKGAPEPETIVILNWSTGQAEERPNTENGWGDGELLAGRLFCKQHSPAAKAQRALAADQLRWSQARACDAAKANAATVRATDINLVRNAISEDNLDAIAAFERLIAR